ncbi:MAG TPA: hypothetical protein VFC59_07365, partial [Cryobacterium sp.]|nr:hypothetical protein [Cryobacterium sp.]
MSLDLSVPDLADAAALERFNAVATAAATVDGYRPFNEQAMLDLAAGLRTPLLIGRQGTPVGAALLGRGELDLVIVPAHRGLGHAGTALQDILADGPARRRGCPGGQCRRGRARGGPGRSRGQVHRGRGARP